MMAVIAVLEDNLRTPSGVFLHVGKPQDDDAVIPELFRQQRIAPVERYPCVAAANIT